MCTTPSARAEHALTHPPAHHHSVWCYICAGGAYIDVFLCPALHPSFALLHEMRHGEPPMLPGYMAPAQDDGGEEEEEGGDGDEDEDPEGGEGAPEGGEEVGT